MTVEKQKAEIIKKALTIVDELAELDIEDKFDFDDIENLIKQANTLKRNRLWKLK